jgi:hypothetical protein
MKPHCMAPVPSCPDGYVRKDANSMDMIAQSFVLSSTLPSCQVWGAACGNLDAFGSDQNSLSKRQCL